ncbi:hypothetical protein GGR19_002743 [Croceicoccus naphthovorans]|nr:hypothetical protein [Croceicoccus naphthovorans]
MTDGFALPSPSGWRRFLNGQWVEIIGPVDSREILGTPARLREFQGTACRLGKSK